MLDAVRDGLGLLLWTQDSFGYADSFDEAAGRYRGLRCGQQVNVSASNLSGLLVRPERAHTQQDAAAATAASGASASTGMGGGAVPPACGGTGGAAVVTPTAAKTKRFHGTVVLDSTRVGRDASRVADEMISHLTGLVGASVKVTLEIEAQLPEGAPEQVVRTVTENARTLKFTSQRFEKE